MDKPYWCTRRTVEARITVGSGDSEAHFAADSEPGEKAGSTLPLRLAYDGDSRPMFIAPCGFWETCTWRKDWSKEPPAPKTFEVFS